MTRLLLLLLALAMTSAAAGTPEEDYRDGAKAYHSGDVVGAMRMLRPAADRGHAAAQALLGSILDAAEFNDEALAYYRKAAEQGNADGEFGLGAMHLAGEGVKADREQALAWFLRAAERNHEQAIKAAANTLLNPAPGQAKADDAVVLRWVRRAAELGDVPAMERLATALRAGELGLAPDPQEAQLWSQRVEQAKKKAKAPASKKKGRS